MPSASPAAGLNRPGALTKYASNQSALHRSSGPGRDPQALTGRAIGAWLLGLGTAAADASLLGHLAAIRPLAVTGVAFGVLQAIALARQADELSRDTPFTVAYVATIATLTAVSAWALQQRSAAQRARTHTQPSET